MTVTAAIGLALVFAAPASALRLLAVGDFGVGGTTERTTGRAIKAWEAEHPARLLVTLGDNDYTESPPAFRQNWSDAFGWLGRAGVRVRGTLGNHDIRVNGGRYEFETLHMPSSYYVRSRPKLDLFVLDSNSVDRAQRRWLRRHLASSTAHWKIVVFHHPAYTCGGYLSNPAVVSEWVPLFRRFGVDVVLSGHDHNYQRFARSHGVTYVVHGGGGQELYALRSCPAGYPTRRFARKGHGFLDVLVRQTSIRLQAVNLSGRVIDEHVINP
ncbi:MAG TPA: metallophosphoesterase [Gaiellaceae bacterium]|nr:metallophosphoesterase [Gaiellaceae bacterium]